MFHNSLRRSVAILAAVVIPALCLAAPGGAEEKSDTQPARHQTRGMRVERSAGARGDGGFLGVSIQKLNDELRDALDISGDVDGVVITNVTEGSAADKAGLRDKDVITRFEGREVTDPDQFTEMVRSRKPGDEVDISAWRDGRTIHVQTTLDRAPRRSLMLERSGDDGGDDAAPTPRREIRIFRGDRNRGDDLDAPRPPRPPRGRGPLMEFAGEPHGRLGVEPLDLNDDIAPYFNVSGKAGALVWSVDDDSPADKAGLKAGDVITEVEGKAVKNSAELRRIIADHDPDDTVAITFLRHGSEQTTKATLEEAKSPEMLFLRNFHNLDNLPGMEGRRDAGPGPGPDGPRFRRPQGDPDQVTRRLERELQRLEERLSQLKEELNRLRD